MRVSCLCSLFTMRWRISSTNHTHCQDVLPKYTGTSNHGLNCLKLWTKTNPSSFVYVKYFVTATRKAAIIKKAKHNTCWQGGVQKETLVYCWQECKLAQPLWKKVSSESSKNRTAIWPTNHTSVYISKSKLKRDHILKGKMHNDKNL